MEEKSSSVLKISSFLQVGRKKWMSSFFLGTSENKKWEILVIENEGERQTIETIENISYLTQSIWRWGLGWNSQSIISTFLQ